MAAGLQGISCALFIYCMVLSLCKCDFKTTDFHLDSTIIAGRLSPGTTHDPFDIIQTGLPTIANQLMRYEALSYFIIRPEKRSRKEFRASRCLDRSINICHPNSLLFTVALLVCGDVHPCPGPGNLPSTSTRKASGLNFLYMNARSLKTVYQGRMSKLRDFEAILINCNHDCVCVTETWLNSTVDDAELSVPGYTHYRKDRSNINKTRGGGLLCAIKDSVLSTRREDLEPDDEILIVEMRPNASHKIAVILCYRSPDGDTGVFVRSVNAALTNITSQFEHIIVIGDFNLPKVKGCHSLVMAGISDCEQEFCDIFNDYFLSQLNHFPSRENCDNILDLVFTTHPDKVNDFYVSHESFNTDHKLLEFNICTQVKKLKKAPRFVYNFKRANFDIIRSILSNADFGIVYDAVNVNVAWSNFLDIFSNVIDRCIPKFKIKDPAAPGWIDAEVRHLQNKKKSAWKKAVASNLAQHWATFRKLRNTYKNLLTLKYKQYINNLGSTLADNPKRFWSFFRQKTKSKSLPQMVKNDNGQTATDAKDKATLFNAYFHSVLTPPKNYDALPHVVAYRHDMLGSISISESDVLVILNNLDVTKAIGPDGLSPRLLKECANQIVSPLSHLFNLSLSTKELPSDWLRANVVPIFKKKDKSCVENYRPVSLLCVCSKVMERAIFNTIFPAIQGELHHLQHGFVKGRSTVSQLLSVYQEVSCVLDKAGQVDLVYLDFSKAFDSVSHKLLLHKLQSFGFHSNLLEWFNSYLRNRQQRVVVEGSSSEWRPVVSGVPQGSVLGPLLFLLYINDMPSSVQHSTVALFADDSKCFKSIKNTSDCRLLQNDLDSLYSWSVEWDLSFNIQKCQTMSISRRKQCVNFDYNLNNSHLERTDSFRDLGVDISFDFVWNSQVSHITSKCNRKLGKIKRTIGYDARCRVS